jgi:hypothetical protein
MSDDSTSPDSASPAKKAKRVATQRTAAAKTAKKAKATKTATAKATDEPKIAKEAVEASASAAPASPAPAASASVAPSSKEAQPLQRLDRPQGGEREGQERSELTQRDESSSTRADRSGGWPEPETVQGGGEGSSSSGKRKRRRKKKGGQGGAQIQGSQESSSSLKSSPGSFSGDEGVSSPSAKPQSAQPSGPRVPIDQDDLAKKAWKIFIGEIGEEGLALVGDQEGRELSRRSFKLAEIFLEEKARRSR